MPDERPPEVPRPDEDEVIEQGLDHLRALAGQLEPADHEQLAPPPGLWQRIAAEAGVPAGAEPSLAVAPAPSPTRRGRRRRGLVLAAAALVLVVVALAAVRATGGGGEPGRRLQEVALSNEGLDPRGRDTSGTATLLERDGRLYLDVDLVRPPGGGDSYLELWLIDRRVDGMVSLGPYRGAGRYLVPPGVDPGAFPIVDVSEERPDGDPTHGGVSIVRGELA